MNAYDYEKMLEEESSKKAKQQFCHHDGILAITKDRIVYNGIEAVRCKCLECDGTFDEELSNISSRAIRVNNLEEYNKLKEYYLKTRELNVPAYEIISYINSHSDEVKKR